MNIHRKWYDRSIIDKLDLDNAYFIETGIDLQFHDNFFIKGSIKNLFHKEKNKLSFYPDHDQYRISVGIRWDFLELGYEHICFHPIFPYSTNGKEWKEQAIINTMIIEGFYNRIYINIELKGKFF